MKVIGKGDRGTYLVEVSHTELEKVADKYYGKLDELKVGQEFNLGAGYDFRQDIKSACRQMVDASKSFGTAQSAMVRFAVMVAGLPEPASESEA